MICDEDGRLQEKKNLEQVIISARGARPMLLLWMGSEEDATAKTTREGVIRQVQNHNFQWAKSPFLR